MILPRLYGADGDTDPPVTPPAPSQITGPWADDVVAAFTDPALQSQVDAFLRTKIQPYTTGLETRVRELEAAGELLQDLQTDPHATYLAIAEQLYPDRVDALRDALEADTEVPAPSPESSGAEGEPTIHPEVQELLEERRAEKAQAAYLSQVDALKTRVSDDEIDYKLLSPFVVAADGDIDKAYESYKDMRTQLAGTASPTPEEVPNPPAVLGSDTATPPAGVPPTTGKYTTLDDALDAMFAESVSPPTPVGAA